MRRREFITLLGGAAAAWPLAARAQQPGMPVIGFMSTATREQSREQLRAFHQGLSETGYVDGRNVMIEYRWAENREERLPALAADLVARHVNVIAAVGGLPSPLAAKAATTTIPIVFTTGADPVALGLVRSLNRPGGNLTGSTSLTTELGAKKLELLREAVPAAKTIAGLFPRTPSDLVAQVVKDIQAAAGKLGLMLHEIHAQTDDEIDVAFASAAQLNAQALFISTGPFFTSRFRRLAELAERYALPAVYQGRDFAVAGGLMSYGGGEVAQRFHMVGLYTGRILKGEKPADLPVQQSTKIELIINMKTAKALGLTFPLTLLGRADEVIE